MSEKRNLAHWSILALRDCKLRRARGFSFFANITLEKGFPARCTGKIFPFTSYKTGKTEMDVDFQNFPSLFSNTGGKEKRQK
ncbi:MAG: hypothetical protein KHW93_09170 [Butyricicoccus pullicaecorum]|nr:hypothetical protein [Butyricicoccus pullicaecorum]